MPTLSQLSQAVTVGDTDEVLLEQGGNACVVPVATLLASTQPRLTLAPGALLGRVGIGAGQPEPVGIGPGLQMQAGAVAADMTVLATLESPVLAGTPTAPTPPPGDASQAIATTEFVMRLVFPDIVTALLALPTTLPSETGQLWWNNGILSQT